ncbi:MAG: hypothetical protein O7D91_01260 [Planctomycetota bacterium]|nr:hypothetical protein [Planctomycetota bacterium]
MWIRSNLRSFSRASGCAVFLAVTAVLAARVQAEPPNSTPAQRPVRSIQEALRLGVVNDQKKPVVGERILRAPIRAFDVIEGPPVGDGGAALGDPCIIDGNCGPGEDSCNCLADCPVPETCGDGICCNSQGEDCATCETDCGSCVFCSGFQPPCTLGYIGGGSSGVPQNCEWHASNSVVPGATMPIIASGHPGGGDPPGEQHLHFEFDPSQPSGPTARNWAFSDNIPNPPVDGVMTLDLRLYINEPGGLNAYHVRPQAPSQGLATAEMVFMPSGDIVCFEDLDPDDDEIDGFFTGFTWVPGEYKAVSICVDNVNNRIRYFYDGDLVWSTGVDEGGQETGVFGATTMEHVLIRYEDNQNDTTFMDVDEVCIKADNCTLPTGACCNIDGQGGCLERTETACSFSETAVWAGLNTDCSPELCNAAESCGLPGTGSCFDQDGTISPGCLEFECCIDVCLVNPECCDVIWDAACAAAAFEICSIPCSNGEPQCQDIGILDAFNATNGEFRVADNFTPSTDTMIGSLCWSGVYLENPLIEDSFTVRYFDCVDGVPGKLIAEYSEANAELFVTGKEDTGIDLAGAFDIFEFTALHLPLSVVAGQPYFIEISNAPPGGDAWFWETMAITDTAGDGEYFQAPYGEDYARHQRGCRADLSFCINVELGELTGVCDVPLPFDCVQHFLLPDGAVPENEACGASDNDQCIAATLISVSHDPTEPTFISGQAFAESGQSDIDWYKFDVQDLNGDNEAVICVTVGSELPVQVELVTDLGGICAELDLIADPQQAVSLPCDPRQSISVPVNAPQNGRLLRVRVADGCDIVEGYPCPNDYVLQISVANTVEDCDGCGLFTCPADLTDDGEVGAFDLAVLLGSWGPCPAEGLCCADQTNDGEVGSFDLAHLLGAWGPCLASLGACCNIDGQGACEQTTADTCGFFGTYLGPGQECSSCPPISCTFGSGDCCAANGTAGCESVDCCADVCEVDPSCCDVEWTAACAIVAEDLCDPCAPPPANDNCADALVIGDGDTIFDTSAATTDGLAHPQCQFDGQTYNDVWYDYTAICTADLTVSTCNQATYDTDLVIYDGCACPPSGETLLGCNDDTPDCAVFTSQLTVPVTTGNCYKIRIGGFAAGNSGTGTVSVTCGGG